MLIGEGGRLSRNTNNLKSLYEGGHKCLDIIVLIGVNTIISKYLHWEYKFMGGTLILLEIFLCVFVCGEGGGDTCFKCL